MFFKDFHLLKIYTQTTLICGDSVSMVLSGASYTWSFHRIIIFAAITVLFLQKTLDNKYQ